MLLRIQTRAMPFDPATRNPCPASCPQVSILPRNGIKKPSARCCQAERCRCTLLASPVYVSMMGRSGKFNDFYGGWCTLMPSATLPYKTGHCCHDDAVLRHHKALKLALATVNSDLPVINFNLIDHGA